jgi:hypothetical protein
VAGAWALVRTGLETVAIGGSPETAGPGPGGVVLPAVIAVLAGAAAAAVGRVTRVVALAVAAVAATLIALSVASSQVLFFVAAAAAGLAVAGAATMVERAGWVGPAPTRGRAVSVSVLLAVLVCLATLDLFGLLLAAIVVPVGAATTAWVVAPGR